MKVSRVNVLCLEYLCSMQIKDCDMFTCQAAKSPFA